MSSNDIQNSTFLTTLLTFNLDNDVGYIETLRHQCFPSPNHYPKPIFSQMVALLSHFQAK